MKNIRYYILLMLSASITAPVYGGSNDVIRNSSLHLLWPKMIKAINNSDTMKFNRSVIYASSELTNYCTDNLIYVEQVKELVASSRKDSAKVLLTRLILTSIIFGEIKLYRIDESDDRLKKAKELFAELLSVKFLVMKYDFVLYQYITKRLKSHNRSSPKGSSILLPKFVEEKLLFTQNCIL